MTETKYTEKDSEYLKNNPTWHIEDSPWKAQQIIKMLHRNPQNFESIAEVGCGAGEILNQLYSQLPKDTNFTGFDVSPDAIQLAKSREKDRLVYRQANFLVEQQKFDLLLMIDVFEHIEDYFGFLKQCKSKADYTIFHIPLDICVQGILRNKLIARRHAYGHLHYFTKETALATLTDCGYQIIDSFYTAGALELPKKTLLAKLAYIPIKLLYMLSKDLTAKLLGGLSLLVLTKNRVQ